MSKIKKIAKINALKSAVFYLFFNYMIIYWHGQSCFTLQGDKTTVVTDPFDKSFGLRVPRLQADVLTISHSHEDHNNTEAVRAATENGLFIIDGPGEYEAGNVFIQGVASYHDASQGADRGQNTMYRFEIDGISIAHLGDVGHKPTEDQMEKLEGIDILLIPVGGVFTINGKEATEIITNIEPRIIIPMHYNIPGLKTSKPLDDISVFCKEIGICPKEVISKYKIAKKDLPTDDMQVVLLTP